ncbi:hypothetical protein NEUTE1DRAFT_100869 [Neurospora tetrasperma FGSC 2508]|uniref:Uncharacterized protein n=1 Tax=Neurospora tetrasperma (strain FGSC 2508 / ATCC MYA-4615 / P0657) TaxID=510951 RepID=F8MMW5_NEUT8|nr:uncharacterized protein NEUTE1DRAFT_100869 [Neurospora tetrasperma FGSC 2508]EGO57989.1 hypothetical protein NEUTE1DRAFT_100869 [Neurospora tetrasperma FGSC 2508]
MPPHENFNHMIVRESQKVVAVGIFPPQPPKTSEPTTRRFGPSRHRLVRVRSRSDGRPTAAPHTGTQRHGGPKAGRRIPRPFCNVGNIADDEPLKVLVRHVRRPSCRTVHPIRNTFSRTPRSSAAKTEPP